MQMLQERESLHSASASPSIVVGTPETETAYIRRGNGRAIAALGSQDISPMLDAMETGRKH